MKNAESPSTGFLVPEPVPEKPVTTMLMPTTGLLGSDTDSTPPAEVPLRPTADDSCFDTTQNRLQDLPYRCQPGVVIDGKYEILKRIGKGGMSVVYLAMDRRLNKQWAVKEIRKRGNSKNDEIVVNSLLAEANLMKRFDHPALPRIVDIIDNGRNIIIVMDYIEGESLDKILEMEGPQSEELVINWAKQLCDVLGYLHSQKPPIIYRDMKPANVMLKPDGNIKIIDFGIAREYKEEKLSDTMVLGTKGYAPPEQYSGQTDARSDIYALGMTMHHLLTGNDPRTGNAYVPVRQYNPSLSKGIQLIINKCVEPAPEKRYQSCSELLQDLNDPSSLTRGKLNRKALAFFESLSPKNSKRKTPDFPTAVLQKSVLPERAPQKNLSDDEIDYYASTVIQNTLD